MVDSVAVLSPTDRVFANGVPVSGAKLKFYNAGTSTPKTVYADAGLSSSLGSTVYTDSDGFPVTSSGGSTKTAIFTGTAAYKVIVTDSSDVTLITLDDLKGALDTSSYKTTDADRSMPVLSKTANYSIVAGDAYKLINANPSGGAFTLTLPEASTAGDGFWVSVRNNASSTSNAVTIARAGSDTIRHRLGAVTSFTIGGGGSGGFLVCDGAGWSWIPGDVPGGPLWESTTIASGSTTDLGASTGPVVTVSGTTTITSFGTAPNRLRIVLFSGALTLTHNGTSLILPGASNATTAAGDVYTFVSDGSGNWRCVGVPPTTAASQAQMEDATSTAVYVTPGRQRNHPLHPKAAGLITISAGTPTFARRSNFDASITDNGTGDFSLSITDDLADTSAIVTATCYDSTTLGRAVSVHSVTASSVRLRCCTSGAVAVDPESLSVIVLGDL